MIKQNRIIMGMPITLMVPDSHGSHTAMAEVFEFFRRVDQTYSPFIETSHVSKINRQELVEDDYSNELREILDLAEQAKRDTDGYFDVWHDSVFDPSGIVKGWAIDRAAEIMRQYTNDFYVEAGGDIQVSGANDQQQPWRIGVRNPFNRDENIAVVSLDNHAIATSGTAIRGQHIYDPVTSRPLTDIVSLSVIAPNIIDADRMATAAFAMGERGIAFIENLPGYEAYMVDAGRRATLTSGWERFQLQPA
ncbi:MAG TPA: FAD:protein FMN transferase [Candidatus Bathyarchaeia archaeon]|nr:FAD:protein FMN transferase [Candidatus Bathyarchaeia archaeon]